MTRLPLEIGVEYSSKKKTSPKLVSLFAVVVANR
jgi:hypothetical protein